MGAYNKLKGPKPVHGGAALDGYAQSKRPAETKRTKVDLKDAYFAIPIHHGQTRSSAPRIFTSPAQRAWDKTDCLRI